MTLVDVLFKAGAVVILVNNTNLGSGIPSLVLLNFSDAGGGHNWKITLEFVSVLP